MLYRSLIPWAEMRPEAGWNPMAPRPRLTNLRLNLRKLGGRVVTCGCVLLFCVVGLSALFPSVAPTIIQVVAVAFVAKFLRDAYLCTWRVMVDNSGIWTCRNTRGQDALALFEKCGIQWDDLAGVEKVQCGSLETLAASPMFPKRLTIKHLDVQLVVSSYLRFPAALRRCLTLSPDLIFQSRLDGTTIVLPLRALDRREQRDLVDQLVQVEQRRRGVVRVAQRRPRVVRYWLGPEDPDSRDEVAEAARERDARLLAAEQEERTALGHFAQNQWGKACEAYTKALATYKEEGGVERVSMCTRSFASCFVRLGRLQEARQRYEEALVLCERLDNLLGQADCHNAVAEIFMHTRGPIGRQEALRRLDMAARLFREAGFGRKLGEIWGNKGLIYQSLAHLAEGLPHDSWWEGCRLGDHIDSLRNAGLDVPENGSWLDCALACHRHALELVKVVIHRQPEPHSLMMGANQLGCIADIFRRRGEYKSALHYYAEEKEVWDSAGEGQLIVQDLSGRALSILADAMAEATRSRPAPPDLLNQAMKLMADSVSAARLHGDEFDMVLTLHRRAEAFRLIGNLEGAVRDLKLAVERLEEVRSTSGSALSRSVLLHEHMDIYGDLIEILVEMHSAEPGRDWALQAFEYCERAKCRALLEHYLSASQQWSVSIPPEAQGDRLLAAQATLSEIEAGRSQQELDATAGTAYRSAGETGRSPESEWEKIGMPEAFQPTLLSPVELIKECVSPGTLVLEMFTRGKRTLPGDRREALLVILPVTTEGVSQPVVYRGAEAEAIFDAAANLRQHAGSAYDPDNPRIPVPHPYGTPLQPIMTGRTSEPNDRRARRVLAPARTVEFDPAASGAKTLYSALVVSPAARSILRGSNKAASRFKRIAFVPHGPLFGDLPFCALHNGQSFLVEEFEVAVCPSLQWQAQALLSKKEQAEKGGCLVLSSPDLRVGAHLICTMLESASHDSKYGQMEIVLGAQKGEEPDNARLILFSSAKDYRGLIVLAHGDAWPSPQLHLSAKDASGGFFPGGDVTLADVYNKIFLRCDILGLLVCFAQQQPVPLGGEWQSLAAAFMARGARAIFAAPHAAHILTTAILLGKAFSAMSTGLSASEALGKVQTAFARGEIDWRYRHPYYWAVSLLGGLR